MNMHLKTTSLSILISVAVTACSSSDGGNKTSALNTDNSPTSQNTNVTNVPQNNTPQNPNTNNTTQNLNTDTTTQTSNTTGTAQTPSTSGALHRGSNDTNSNLNQTTPTLPPNDVTVERNVIVQNQYTKLTHIGNNYLMAMDPEKPEKALKDYSMQPLTKKEVNELIINHRQFTLNPNYRLLKHTAYSYAVIADIENYGFLYGGHPTFSKNADKLTGTYSYKGKAYAKGGDGYVSLDKENSVINLTADFNCSDQLIQQSPISFFS